MAEGYAELIERGYEAWNAGDRSWVLQHLSPDIEWATPADDPEPSVYHGHDEVIRFWDTWRAAVGQLEFEILELRQSGPHTVVRTKRTGKGAHSGLEVSDKISQVFTFEGSLCVRVREFYDHAEALAAAGVAAGAEADRRV